MAATQPRQSRHGVLSRLRGLGGAFRSGQARALGLPARTLTELRDAGHLEQLSRGLFRLTSLPAPAQPDLLIVAARLPRAVLCLISALAFHDLTDEVPHEVYIALPRGAEQPRLEHPPLHVVRLRPVSFEAGVETHRVDGLDLRVYAPAKTVADCFQFRAQVGLDTALAALKALRRRRGFDPEDLLRFARICRVERLVRRYLEAIL
ncbi:MAG: type IV toxin-antitoxin system AbiEi family antitoxin domain-containing protein [Planctomycetota bacterium]